MIKERHEAVLYWWRLLDLYCVVIVAIVAKYFSSGPK